MTSNDLKCMMEFVADGSEVTKNLKACLLSPTQANIGMTCGTSEWGYFHNLFHDVTVLTEHDWDLNHERDYKFDIIVANNILMYSKTPKLWFDNIMNSCKMLLIQDIMKRQRSSNSEYGNDGDSTRYSIGKYSYFNDTLNISQLKYRIIRSCIYNGNASEYEQSPRHFISLITHDT
jgi:hypothetical protein